MTRTLEDHYGLWTVLEPGATPLCQCECGTKKRLRRYDLLNGRTRSCGCALHELNAGNTWNTDNLAPEHSDTVHPGAQFGRLTITGEIQPSHKRHTKTCPPDCNIPLSSEAAVECRCNCDNRTVKTVYVRRLRDRTTRSCGCLKRDAGRARYAV